MYKLRFQNITTFCRNIFVVFRYIFVFPSPFLISQGTNVLLFPRFIFGIMMRTHIVMTDTDESSCTVIALDTKVKRFSAY